ncbi:MAG TPA: retroviral-like aspartic protease family protein [Caulobacteraceae bacterium]
MANYPTNRRHAIAAAAAALLWRSPSPAAAQMARVDLLHDPASRLGSRGDAGYTPPTELKTVADIYRRMTLAIGVNGSGPYPFVVDTGANQSVISSELCARLGLPAGAPAPLNGVAGIRIAPTTKARLVIGKRVLEDQVLSVLPTEGIGGPGMLGLDCVGEAALTLDFANRDLRIDMGRSNWRDPDAVAVKASRRDGQLTLVNVSLAGAPLLAFVDSGAQSTIGNMALREVALTRSPKSQWTQTRIISSTGQSIVAEMAYLSSLRVGKLIVPDWPVAFADLHTFQMWNMIDKPAILLGVDILSRFQYVCLDFARDEVRFRLA